MIMSIAVMICWKGSVLNERDILKAHYYVWTQFFTPTHKVIFTKVSTVTKILVFPNLFRFT